jgi:hypothetical protein
MMMLFGYELELFAGTVIAEHNGMNVRSGRDLFGGHWLIVAEDDDPEHMVWVCAPATVLALQELAAGHASVVDVVRHGASGMVEVVTAARGRAVPDRSVCCADLPDELLPTDHGQLAVAA